MVAPSHSPEAAQDPSLAMCREGAARLLLICRVGGRALAVPCSCVERILRMAAVAPLPDSPPPVVGLLDLHGSLLPVVDPRPALGTSTPPFHPTQRLIALSVGSRYLLWVDAVDRIVSAPAHCLDTVEVVSDRLLAPLVARLDAEVIPVLSPEALDPGPIIRKAPEAAR